METQISDTERLEYITSRDIFVTASRDGEYCWLVNQYPGDDEEPKRQKHLYNTFREAIDAAILGLDSV